MFKKLSDEDDEAFIRSEPAALEFFPSSVCDIAPAPPFKILLILCSFVIQAVS